MGLFDKFLENLRQFGLEYYGRYYGTYRGTVHNNKDPQNRGRVWVKVPAIAGGGVLANRAYPKMPFAGNKIGFFFPPEEGDTIYVQFENGDPQFPIYEGGYWNAPGGTTETPDCFLDDDADGVGPKRRGIRTAAGHELIFDDTDDAQIVTLFHTSGSIFTIDNDGNVKIEAVGDTIDVISQTDIFLTVGGTVINVKDGMIGLGAEAEASDKAVLESLVQDEFARIKDDLTTMKMDFDNHTHPLPDQILPLIPAGPGPTLPGVVPAPPSMKPTVPMTAPTNPNPTNSELVTIDS